MGSSGSGEGSRGGQIVGHTRAGKPIYASHLNSTGKMAHAGAIAGAAAAGGGPRPAVLKVTHGKDGQAMAPGKYSSARETFEVGPSGKKIGRTIGPVAPLPKLPPLRQGTNQISTGISGPQAGMQMRLRSQQAQDASTKARNSGSAADHRAAAAAHTAAVEPALAAGNHGLAQMHRETAARHTAAASG